jgi:AcrR family transcriptional regulator
MVDVPVDVQDEKLSEAGLNPVRRDPVQTRRNILDAAIREFAAHGFQGGRTDRIALDAGVGKRMIFHYFDSKDGLFAAVLEATYAKIRRAEASLELKNRSPEDAIAVLVGFSFDWFIEHPEFVPLLNEENLHRGRHLSASRKAVDMTMPLVDQLQSILKAGEAQGTFRKGVDPVDLYVSIAGVSYFYFSNHHTLGSIFDRDFMSPERIKMRRRHVIELILGFLTSKRANATSEGTGT